MVVIDALESAVGALHLFVEPFVVDRCLVLCVQFVVVLPFSVVVLSLVVWFTVKYWVCWEAVLFG